MRIRIALIAWAFLALGISATPADVLYVATSSGVSVSADGGLHWTYDATVLGGLAGNRVLGLSVVGPTMYAATWLGGLWIGGNGIWITYSRPVISANLLSVYVGGSDVYACSLMGLWMSTNGGTTWTGTLQNGGVVVNRVTTAGSTIFAATNGAGLALSNDGGRTWKSYLGTNGVADVCVSGSTIYVATQPVPGGVGGGLWVSTDAGSHWSQFLANTLLQSVYAVGATIYAASDTALLISTDRGQTWKSTLAGRGVRRIALEGSTTYAASSSGVWDSTDGGSTWANWTTSNGLSSNDVYDLAAQ